MLSKVHSTQAGLATKVGDALSAAKEVRGSAKDDERERHGHGGTSSASHRYSPRWSRLRGGRCVSTIARSHRLQRLSFAVATALDTPRGAVGRMDACERSRDEACVVVQQSELR